MKRSIIAAIAVAGVAGAIAVPTIVSGNARRTEPTGSLYQGAKSEIPYVANLTGASEFPGPGDPDGSGAATMSFGATESLSTVQVCWDISYSGIAPPTAAHIHAGAAGTSGGVQFTIDPIAAGCGTISNTLADAIQANPGNYYVNIHNADFPNGAIRGQLTMGPKPAGSAHFLLTPLRAFDSRNAPATKLAAGTTQTISLRNGVDGGGASALAVPPGATAAIVTITVTDTDGPGYVSAYSAASAEPATSSVNFTASGATVAVSTQVLVDSAGEIKVTAGVSGTHVIIDVIGYLY